MKERKSLIQTLREQNVGEEISFPTSQTRTIRNYCTLLNAENYTNGKRWACYLKKEQGVIIAGRIR